MTAEAAVRIWAAAFEHRIAAAWGQQALEILHGAGVEAPLRLLHAVAEQCVLLGDVGAATQCYEQALLVLAKDRFRRERAVTMGKIADVLEARGDLDEALRIRREEQLPVYERLGDVRSLLVGQTNLAITYLARDQEGDRETATTLLHNAFRAARKMGLPEAQKILAILDSAKLPLPPQV